MSGGLTLAVDAGNTRIKWGIFDGSLWRVRATANHQDADQLHRVWSRWPAPGRVGVCNVAGSGVGAALLRSIAVIHHDPHWIVPRAEALGVRNGYGVPERLGADRWAALVAAWTLAAEPTVVVTAGTATTVDALDGEGRFRGGIIIPGLALMASTLASRTAGIPLAAGGYAPWPDNTADAVATGALLATAGAVERLRRTLAQATGRAVRCVVTGGAASPLVAHLPGPLLAADTLVLDGIRLIVEGGGGESLRA